MIPTIVYAVAALIGMALYMWNSWPSNEAFNPQKAINTVIRGGGLSIILAAIAFAPMGINVTLVGMAFMMGFTFDAGLKKLSDAYAPTTPSQTNG
ncbi:MAG: hypothetical protein WC365_04255 [Candidatus Babeliales bacterium]